MKYGKQINTKHPSNESLVFTIKFVVSQHKKYNLFSNNSIASNITDVMMVMVRKPLKEYSFRFTTEKHS